MQKEKNLWITSGEVTIGIGENAGSLVPIIGFPTGAFDDTLNRQALFRMGLTYVVQALNKTLFMNADWNEGIYRTVMPLLSVEFVVVDKRGCIVHDARSGAIAADAPPGLEPAGQEQIVHLSDAGGAEFQNAVAAAVSAERKTTLVPVLGPDEMPRLVLVTPLEAAQSGHALVIYEGEDSDTTWLLDQLFGIYRLTRSEKQVARGIVLGKTVTEIAADADWSVATVRSYVKQVLSKMGLHRQSELIQLYHSSKLPIVPKPEMRLTARPA
ncbi:MAG: helix-turn-helix transcriptional regulator [Roseovarius sp.]